MWAVSKYVSRPLCNRISASKRDFSRVHRLNSKPVVKAPFKDSLQLPHTSFPLKSDLAKSELAFQSKTCNELYHWQWTNSNGPLFVLHDGPPYANGRLHMGHALNKIIKDIINRFNVLMGRKVHYIPGWDCHGLPIEHNALQQLGSDPHALSRTLIRSKAMDFAKREMEVQREEFSQLGIMADWSPGWTYRTLDHEYEIRQLKIFQKMVEKGLIYRHHRPVHYSPSSRSALAEAELVYRDDHISLSVYVSYTIDPTSEFASSPLRDLLAGQNKVDLMIWTTTPWTLTANMGIAVHPGLTYSALKLPNRAGLVIVAKDRITALEHVIGPFELVGELTGLDLVGSTYVSPFTTGSRFKVIPSSHVTIESGTGLVHCAPAHGMEDYAVFQALGLARSGLLCHVDAEGKFTGEVASVTGETDAKSIVGLDVLKGGSKAIVKLLEDAGALVKLQKIKHKYPYDWKTGEPIIIMVTSQWFANLDNIKEDSLRALQDVTFYPPISRNRLESFVRSRSEWCISRQRAWGVPIPALHHIPTGSTVLDPRSLEHILALLEAKGVNYWWEGPVEEFVPPYLYKDGVEVSDVWRKGTDTMDVWFDSGSSWSMLKDLTSEPRQFLADVCVEGSDQHRGWFQSQLLTCVGFSGQPKSPYGALITHGMVLDQSGKKMSKSLGNIVRPIDIINGGKNTKNEPAYGTDVLRLWAATVESGSDSPIGPAVLAQCTESLRKIRNSARFILGNTNDKQTRGDFKSVPLEEMALAERYIMHELYKLEQTALAGYSLYNFPKVMAALNSFANVTLSSLYFDITKDCLYANSTRGLERRSVVTVFEQVLHTITSVMAPVLPHLAEEVHHYHSGGGDDVSKYPSIFTRKWEPLSPVWEDPSAERDMNNLIRLRGVVLALLEKARVAKNLRSSLEAEVDVILPNHMPQSDFVDLLQREERFLKTLFIVSDASLTDEGSLGTSLPGWVYSETVLIPETDAEICIRIRPATLEKCPRCWQYTREESETLCARCDGVVHE